MGRNYSANAVDTTLSVAITSSATTFSVAASVGFPAAPFVIAVIDSPGAQEIMLVTGVVGTTLTVTRGYDETTAAAHPATAVVRHVASAIDFRESALHIDAVSGVHGVGAGSVVGTSTTQTLTNKNLTSGTNTFPTFITGYLVPTGAGMEWPSTAAAPTGWLRQDGGEYLISSFTALYNFLTTNGTVFPFGANTNGTGGAGSTHFVTPRRAGKVAVGYLSTDTDFNAIGKTGGAKTHTLTIAQMPSHSHGGGTGLQSADHSHTGYTTGGGGHEHNYAYPNSRGSISGGGGLSVADNSSFTSTTGGGGGHEHNVQTYGASANHSHAITAEGGGSSHNIMNPYIVMNYIIKT